MRRFIFLLLVTISANSFSSPHYSIRALQQIDTANIIEGIRREYQEISNRINSYKKATKDILGQSSEGGQADVYYDGDDLKKMIIIHFGEIGKISTEYYFDGGKIFFIYIKRTMYDKPIYEKGSKVSSVEEDRFYFYQDKMIRWVDSSKKMVKPTSGIFLLKEKELLNANLLKFDD